MPFWPVLADYGLKQAGFGPVFPENVIKSLKMALFDTQGDTFGPRTENSGSKSPSMPPISGVVLYGMDQNTKPNFDFPSALYMWGFGLN